MKNHQNRESTTNTFSSNSEELGTDTPLPSPDTQLSNNQLIKNQKYDALLQIIEAREKQRARALWIVLIFSLFMIFLLYCFSWGVFNRIFDKASTNSLDKLFNLWHILLIVLLPPTSLLMMLIRGVSFSANSSEFKSSDKDKENKENLLNSIPTPTTTIMQEGKEILIKVIDTVSPNNDSNKGKS